MSPSQPVPLPHALEPDPVANDAWYLRSQGRRFGPLTEDEMRGYFRAGMVKAVDTVAVPSKFGEVSAAEAAALLDEMVSPATGAELAPKLAAIYFERNERRGIGGLAALGAFVALVGIVYFRVHVPASIEAPLAVPTTATLAILPAPESREPQAAPENGLVVEPTHDSDVAPQPTPTDAAAPSAAVSALAPVADATSIAANPTPQTVMDSWWSEGQRLYDAGDWNALVAHAIKWAAAEPRRDFAPWYLGLAYARLGNYAAAVDAYKQALAISPNHFRLRWALADAYTQMHQYRESAELLEALIKETPNDTGLWNDLGINWANLGEYDDSVAALQKAVQLDPGNRRAWDNLAQTYAHFGYPDKAKEVIVRSNAR